MHGPLVHARLIGCVAAFACMLAFGQAGAWAAKAKPRIVHGAATPIVDAPFQVALYDPELVDPEEPDNLLTAQFCGGVIRDATHVITAAHCVTVDGLEAVAPEEVEVLAGSADLEVPEAGAFRDPVVTTSFDPEWNPLTSEHDLGVLTLEKPLWTGATPEIDGTGTEIAPLAFEGGYPSIGSNATVSGWGFDKPVEPEQEPTPGELQEGRPALLQSAQVSILFPAECASDYEENNLLRSDFICANGAGPPVTDSCFGDSGGPLFSGPPGSSSDRLLGLVDFGEGCAQKAFPGVYQSLVGDNLFFAKSDPPQAPRNLATPSISGTPEAGRSIACEPGDWQPSGLEFRYVFYREDAGGLRAITSELSGPSYQIQPGDVGASISCLVIARNGGGVGEAISDAVSVTGASAGSSVAQSSPASPAMPAPASTPPLAELPTLRLLSAHCRRSACVVVVRVGKAAGQASVAVVEAELSFVRRAPCRKHGRRASCVHRSTRKVRAQRLPDGRFSLTVQNLRPGAYTLTLLAVDDAGRRQTHATKVALALAAPRASR